MSGGVGVVANSATPQKFAATPQHFSTAHAVHGAIAFRTKGNQNDTDAFGFCPPSFWCVEVAPTPHPNHANLPATFAHPAKCATHAADTDAAAPRAFCVHSGAKFGTPSADVAVRGLRRASCSSWTSAPTFEPHRFRQHPSQVAGANFSTRAADTDAATEISACDEFG